jgi:HD superfamily phosphohydrolase YqeK
MKLITDPEALERDADKIEEMTKGAEIDDAYRIAAKRLRDAAKAIREGKIKGIPSR